MDLNINVKIPAIEKLLDYTACGIGSVAGPMLKYWKAQQESKAKLITANAEADSLRITAKAQSEARNILITQGLSITGELNITDTIEQRIQFQEEKRQRNIESVVTQAALQLGDKVVENSETDLDWTARFFNDVQDVSSEELQFFWAKVLAGEVERKGSISIRALSILKNIDRDTASLFKRLCSVSMFLLSIEGKGDLDARVCSLGESAGLNSLEPYGLNFTALNILNEHGLIIPEYDTLATYGIPLEPAKGQEPTSLLLRFRLQNRHWVLDPINNRDPSKNIEVSGVAMTRSGIELANVVELEPMEQFVRDLGNYLKKIDLQLKEI